MSTLFGRKITSDSIVLNLDFSNRKCFVPNLLNYSNWQVGSGVIPTNLSLWGASSYSINGQNTENIRVIGSNPFQYSNSVIWKASTIDPPLITGGGGLEGDGGFDTGYVQIDPNKMYRYSIWTKRDSMTPGPTQSGQFYFGNRTYDSSYNLQNVISKTTNSLSFSASNTYFHATPNTYPSTYTDISSPYLGGLNVWTLVVAHVWPVGSTHGVSNTPGTNINSLPANSSHPDSGVWTIQNGKIGNLLYATSIDSGYNDWIWNATSSYTKHRAYHYYSGDITATQSFIYPRIDLIDGLEPSVTELLSGPEPVRDMSSKMNVIYPFSSTNFDINGKGIVFSGVESEIIGGTISSTFSVYSMSIWFKPSAQITSTTPFQTLVQFGNTNTNPFILYLGDVNSVNVTNEVITICNSGNLFTSVYSPLVLAAVWQNLTIVWQGSLYFVYLNGVQQTTTSGASVGNATPNYYVDYMTLGGRKYTGQPWAGFFQGTIGSVVVYERALTPAEVSADFNSMRQKYGV